MIELQQRNNVARKFMVRILGIEQYYTGKAGTAWVSSAVAHAFQYSTQEEAQRTADRFNGTWNRKEEGRCWVAEEYFG